jgi:hypothetical protein
MPQRRHGAAGGVIRPSRERGGSPPRREPPCSREPGGRVPPRRGRRD